jgi:hypothetical protein
MVDMNVAEENIVTDEVISLYRYAKDKINGLIREHQHEIINLKKTLERVDEIMYEKCDHDWERDPPQMYTPTQYTCKKCRLGK